jgi:hypothetical protein
LRTRSDNRPHSSHIPVSADERCTVAKDRPACFQGDNARLHVDEKVSTRASDTSSSMRLEAYAVGLQQDRNISR